MEATVHNYSANPISYYWDKVKDLDDRMKLELVTMLIDSVRLNPAIDESEEAERERGFRKLAGCWLNDHDEDDVEAIIRQGRQSRIPNRLVPSFDD